MNKSTYPIIKYISINAPFRFLWLMYLNNVDLSQHCKAGLEGGTSKRFNPNMKYEVDIKLDEYSCKAYYLCGVNQKFIWNKNFHLAFVYDNEKSIKIEEQGIKIIIENAKRIPIVSDDIIMNYPRAKERLYHTCRNYQFAWTFLKMFYPQKYQKIAKEYGTKQLKQLTF